MILNIFFMVIVASFLASVFLKYLDLKDSVLATCDSQPCVSKQLVGSEKTRNRRNDRAPMERVVGNCCRNNFHRPHLSRAVASRMFEPVFNWFSATLLSSGSIKSVLNIYDGGIAIL